jgi:hypothetical protein
MAARVLADTPMPETVTFNTSEVKAK